MYPRMFCAKFGWNGPIGFGEGIRRWELYNDDDGRHDTIFIRTAHLCQIICDLNDVFIYCIIKDLDPRNSDKPYY